MAAEVRGSAALRAVDGGGMEPEGSGGGGGGGSGSAGLMQQILSLKLVPRVGNGTLCPNSTSLCSFPGTPRPAPAHCAPVAAPSTPRARPGPPPPSGTRVSWGDACPVPLLPPRACLLTLSPGSALHPSPLQPVYVGSTCSNLLRVLPPAPRRTATSELPRPGTRASPTAVRRAFKVTFTPQNCPNSESWGGGELPPPGIHRKGLRGGHGLFSSGF